MIAARGIAAPRFVIRLKYELAIVRHAIGRVEQAIGN
jgi:hypothetical protein